MSVATRMAHFAGPSFAKPVLTISLLFIHNMAFEKTGVNGIYPSFGRVRSEGSGPV